MLIPAVGNLAAHIVSTILGVSFLLGITLLTLAWIGPRSLGDGWRLGATWLLLTIAFESLASYLIFGASWHTLLAGYHSLRGGHLDTDAVRPSIFALVGDPALAAVLLSSSPSRTALSRYAG